MSIPRFSSATVRALRNLSPGEDLGKVASDGEFHGSFSLLSYDIEKGKQKERAIQESGSILSSQESKERKDRTKSMERVRISWNIYQW
jgi:hypothetical protein